MLTMTATEVSRNFSRVLDSLDAEQETVLIMRNKRPVARLVHEPKRMTFKEIINGIRGSITEEEGEQWLKDIKAIDRTLASDLRDPWA